MRCTNQEHDERFKGVFFTKNSCLACELEMTKAQLAKAEDVLNRVYKLLEDASDVVVSHNYSNVEIAYLQIEEYLTKE